MNSTLCPRTLVILMYHAVVRSPLVIDDWCFLEEAVFRQQMEYLKRHFEILPLSQAIEPANEEGPDTPTVAITFDDGFQNNFDVAFPILNELSIPATIFLPTEFIGSAECIWFCQVNRAFTKTTHSSLSWKGREYDLTTKSARAHASALIQAQLKTYPHPRLLEELRLLVAELGEDPDKPAEDGSPYLMLSGEAIRQMMVSRLIEFGGHTKSHAILSLLPYATRKREIVSSIARIRELTGKPCSLFSFPNGRPEDYDARCIAVLKAAGVMAAVTATEGINHPGQPLLELQRFGIGSDTTFPEFISMIDYA